MAVDRQVPKPQFTITYNGKDVTRSLSPYITSIVYEDTIEGESSSLEIELENTSLLFSNGWYPKKSATLALTISTMDCGSFILDEIELKGPPSSITIKGLTNVITKRPLKTKRSKAHEKTTLAHIAQSVANANGLRLVGSVPNIPIDRVTQRRETDLKFLRRISWDYGIVFSVRDTKLVFTYLVDLDKRPPALSLDMTQLTSWTIKDKTDKTYKGAIVRSHSPQKADVVSGSSNIETLQNKDNVNYTQITGADRLVVHKKAENSQQAEAMANAAFYRANSWVQSGTINAPGNATIIAGNNIELTGLGIVGSGVYNLVKVTHTITRDGSWVFDADVKRVATVSKVKQKGKKVIQPGTTSKIVTLQNKDQVKYTQIEPL